MLFTLKAPSTIDATIMLPSSKSVSNRALIIHALSVGDELPRNLSVCDDTLLLANALQHKPHTIDVGAAGTTMRFLTAYFAVTQGEHILTGSQRMLQRPIGPLVDALRYLGADIEYLGDIGYPPLRVRGKHIVGGHVDMPGNVSSQFISALLMIGPVLRGGLELHITGDMVSRPYIDLTMCMMRDFGADVEWTDADTICVGSKSYAPHHYVMESDWSAASYWYEQMAITNDMEASVRLRGLADASRQGDSIVKYIYSMLGVKTRFGTDPVDGSTIVTLHKQPCTLPRFDYNFTSVPDLAQSVVVACAMRGIPFRFSGLASLRIKETDRIVALKHELLKLGYVLTDESGDTLVWDGTRCEPTSNIIETYEDHRMAMAFAPAALLLPGLSIANPQVVTKSYPQFWDHLQYAGWTIDKTKL